MSSRKMNNISSSSEDDEARYAMIADEKKRKRMISNRESARRSRMKREQHVKDLNDQITYFTTKNGEMAKKTDQIGKQFVAVDSENRVLRMHVEDLKKRLEMLEKMVGNVPENNNIVEDEDDGFVMNILQDPWLHHSFQSQNVVDGIYQF